MENIDERLEIAQKIIDGEITIKGGILREYNNGEYMDKPCGRSNILSKLLGPRKIKTLGKGVTGKVFGILTDPDFALKRTRYSDEDIYLGINNRYRPENVEVTVLKLLNDLIFIRATPHIPLYLGDFVCDTPVKEYRLYEDEDRGFSRYTIVEKAKYNLSSFIKNLETYKLTNDDIYRNIIFQIIYTLRIIQKRFPTFRHNDLHDSNVLVFVDKKFKSYYSFFEEPILFSENKFFKYSVDGNDYYVPDMGFRVAIWDFDLTSINGFIENIKVEDSSVGYPFGSEKNKYADMFKILNVLNIDVSNNEPNTREFIKKYVKHVGKDVNIDINNKKYPIARFYSLDVDVHYSSPEIALKDAYFGKYHKKKKFTESYSDKYVKDFSYMNKIRLKIRDNYILKLNCPEYTKNKIPFFEYRTKTKLTDSEYYKTRIECLSSKTMDDIVEKLDIEDRGMLKLIYIGKFGKDKYMNKILDLAQILTEYCIEYLYIPYKYMVAIMLININESFFYITHYHKIHVSKMAKVRYTSAQLLDFTVQLHSFRVVMNIENSLLEKYGITKFEDIPKI